MTHAIIHDIYAAHLMWTNSHVSDLGHFDSDPGLDRDLELLRFELVGPAELAGEPLDNQLLGKLKVWFS